MNSVYLINLLLASAIVVLGALAKYFPGILAGYDKNKPNAKTFPHLVCVCSLAMGAALFALTLAAYVADSQTTAIAGMLTVPLLLMGVLVFVNFKYGRGTVSGKKTFWGLMSVVAAVVAAVLLTWYQMYPRGIGCTQNEVETSGFFSDKISFGSVDTVTLEDALPEIKYRVFGFALGGVKKGNFRAQNDDVIRLYVQTTRPPFIRIKTADQTYFMNEENALQTTQKFRQIYDAYRNAKSR